MMKKRKIYIAVLILSIILSNISYSLAINSKNGMPSDEGLETAAIESEISVDESKYIEESTSDKYNHLLREWSNNSDFPNDSNIEYPSFYGGSSIDPNNDMVIYVTSLDRNITGYFEDIINLDDVRFSKVTHSFQELRNTQEALNNYIQNCEDEKIRSSITGTGISFENNAVNVYISSSASKDLPDVLLKKLSSKNDSCNLNFITFDLNFGGNTTPDISSDLSDVPSSQSVDGIIVQPGSPIAPRTSSTPPSRPTLNAGFWAKNSNGDLGIVTAGHGNIYNAQPVYAYSEDWSKKVYFGKLKQYMFSGNVDAAFVRRDDYRFNPITYVDGWDFDLKSQTKNMQQGETVFKRAVETGVTMGTVLDTQFNPYAHSAGDVKITRAVLVDCVAAPGDSGGIVAGGGTISSRYVAGILSGGGTLNPGTENETSAMYYSEASYILDALDLTLY